MLHIIWGRFLIFPVVLNAFEQYDQNRRKQKAGNSRTLQVNDAKLKRDEIKMIRRGNVKIDRTDS